MLKKIRHLPQHTKVPTTSLTRIIKIGLVVFIIGVVIEVLIINRSSTLGAKISQIEREKAELELDNADLRDKLYRKISLNESFLSAGALGFEAIKNIEYIK